MTHRRHNLDRRERRALARGSVYVLVLGASVLVMIVGLAAAGIARAQLRSVTSAGDGSSAATAAAGAIEIALNALNTDSAWTSALTHGSTVGPLSIGDSAAVLTVLDPNGGSLVSAAGDTIRVFAQGKHRTATRYCSVEVVAGAIEPMDVLRLPMHSATGISIAGGVYASAGSSPVSTAGTLILEPGATLNGDAQFASVVRAGTITGSVTRLSMMPAMPGTDAWMTLTSRAIRLSYNSLTAGTLEKCVLSSTSNPVGMPNLLGTYVITVPAGQTLTIRRCRIDATLLVELGANSSLQLTEDIFWQPRNSGIALLVRSTQPSNVSLSNTVAAFQEAAVGANLNPIWSPFQGASDQTMDDAYVPMVRGIIHVMGTPEVRVGSNFGLIGTLIADGAISIKESATFATDPALLQSVPAGYTKPRAMRPVAGSYRWETAETLTAAGGRAASIDIDLKLPGVGVGVTLPGVSGR